MLSIGEFSRLTHLSVRTLRRFHDAGLFEPAQVDRSSSYRYYTPEKIPTAQVIQRLRELEIPLADVRRILRSPIRRRAPLTLVADHLRRLESQLEQTRVAVASLQRLLRPEPAGLQVELRAVPAATVAAVEDDVDRDDVLGWYAGAISELDAVVPERAGCPGGLYDALFETGRGHLLVHRPAVEPPRIGRVHPAVLPAVELAVTTHLAEHHDIDVTYGWLGTWVVENALAVAGPVRETYSSAHAAAWRTEIGWPVFRVGTR